MACGGSPTQPETWPSVRGTWEGQFDGVRVRLVVTDALDAVVRQDPSEWQPQVKGSGTMLDPLTDSTMSFSVYGSNSSSGVVLFLQDFALVYVNSYGYFTGRLSPGGALVGTLSNGESVSDRATGPLKSGQRVPLTLTRLN